PSKDRLVLTSSGTQTTSDLYDGGTLSAPSLPGSSSDPQGMLQIAAGATLRVSGQTTLDKATLLLDDPAGDGSTARLLAASPVATGGTRKHVAQSTTPTGSSSSNAPMTISVPVINNGTVTLETSLTVPAGYTQDVAVGAPASAPGPVTGLLGSAVLSGSNSTTS